ncbi:pyridoxal phosphate-dependent decarboxylase family protein [Vibrio aestuarianus]|uniref:Pyridoxal-dependent decarboxylase n=1 Tax=Vibrio aestuarianus TaxID=28171 RepID=A0ABD7YQ59_9VIBR|nr:pyridoxal-dependent decarboxylase [Vibrio aestuarianus]WGK87096.1 pyridoxal-dependent decarboxylase [Vibrio aestuarianus]CAH8237074.1 putative Aspartate aminotransferase superfamily of pyridoxal phosphate -dependent enzyme [Vibrio aestuarianus]
MKTASKHLLLKKQAIYRIGLDEKANQVTSTFNLKFEKMRAQFFARDPKLWPLYRIHDIADWLDGRRLNHRPAAISSSLQQQLLNINHIPNDSRDVMHPFDSLALYAAKHSKNWDDPRSVENVISTPCDPAIHGALLATIANPNLVYSEYAGDAAELEKLVVRQIANLVGYNVEQSSGLFTQGGTFCNLYGYLLGIRKALCHSAMHGLAEEEYRIFNSEAGHYSNMTNLSLLGLDIKGKVIRIKVNDNNQMDITELEQQLTWCFKHNIPVPAIMLTFGTTDTFAIDDIERVYSIREKLCKEYSVATKPHLHVDAAVGWSLLFFKNYDVERNPLAINAATLNGIVSLLPYINSLKLADSFTVDFQKWGYVPYTSSLLMVKNKQDLAALKTDPSYYSYFEHTQREETHLQSTIECSRSAVGVFSAYSALQYLGVEGYQTAIANTLQNANFLRCQLVKLPHCWVAALANQGPSVVFRLYDPQKVTCPDKMFEQEMASGGKNGTIDSMIENTLYHRQQFLQRKGMHLNTNWVGSIARTRYDLQGHCLHIPGEKAVLMNPNTTRARIERFVRSLDPD